MKVLRGARAVFCYFVKFQITTIYSKGTVKCKLHTDGQPDRRHYQLNFMISLNNLDNFIICHHPKVSISGNIISV